jgi:uncharacterized cupin superfamily protein
MRKIFAPQRGTALGLDATARLGPDAAKLLEDSMPLIAAVTQEGTAPEIDRPDPSKVIAGDPVHTTWNIEEVDGLYCGMWQSTPGKWRISYAEWEYVHILQGHSILTDAKGTQTHLRAGDSFIIRPGFEGTWEVVETTLKDYVIRS